MSYQVLARKWRPAHFKDVVGQAHVVTALSNALDQDRVHHAFLFTGTRGVGKTTLARIFAKALNCDKGVSSTPCGECSACVAVSEGRFIDLIEVDAASRTKVDDTRELLDNVQYAPTQGRYKVYLIDEVHMLSTHSFNALLKTLEEPPEHVKFLLATTDPQKLPMTVLSRCIQFSLNAIEPRAIENQLKMILDSEQLAYEPAAIQLLAKAADGSLRDGLSLLDQAIAYSDQSLTESSIRQMMGLVDGQAIIAILDSLVKQDASALMACSANLVSGAQDLKTALDDLLSYLHTLALYQFAPDAIEYKRVNADEVERLAAVFPAQTLQLYYQIVLKGKQDFALAPDPRTGFEMVLLRLLAFMPAKIPAGSSVKKPPTLASPERHDSPAPAQNTQAKGQQTPDALPENAQQYGLADEAAAGEPLEGGLDNTNLKQFLKPASSISQPKPKVERVTNEVSMTDKPVDVQANSEALIEIDGLVGDIDIWSDFILKSGLKGVTRQLAVHMTPLEFKDGVLKLVLDSQYANLQSKDRIAELNGALERSCADKFKLSIELGEVAREKTAAGVIAERERAALEKTRQNFKEDDNVKALVSLFEAQVDDGSIKSTD